MSRATTYRIGSTWVRILTRLAGVSALVAVLASPALAPRPVPAAGAPAWMQLAETFPVETTLDDPALPSADAVWLDMIQHARSTLDFAEFYASNAPDSRLEPIVKAIEAAAARGVRVRFLAEEKFYRTYPETLERLAHHDGITMRRYDVAKLMGGVLHAKYFIVDGEQVWLGSQNFDWRALTHIQELGARVVAPAVTRAFADVFETDWQLAGGANPTFRAQPPEDGYGFPVRVALRAAQASAGAPPGEAPAPDSVDVTPVFSPKGWLPDESLWDLPRLVDLLDSAQSTLRIAFLSYHTVGYDRTFFPHLDNALRRAAARGVRVQLLVADWSKRKGRIEALKSLQVMPGIDVKLVTIPQWSGGFIPFARVIHAKYVTADGARSWIGTSNWEKGYFHDSRNVGLMVDGAACARQLEAFFDRTWSSPYAELVDPGRDYTPPRIGS